MEPSSARQRIEGVEIKPLRYHLDDRGRLLEILRRDDPIFQKFGQVYLTTAYPGVVKAWHAHQTQYDHLVCIKGSVLLVLYDDREGSPTRGLINEFLLSEYQPMVVQIPPGIWHGFKNVGTEEALVLNIPTEPYRHEAPDELRRPAHGDIPYDWTRRDR